MPSMQFFYDIASPYSYLAATRVDAEAAAAGVTVRWRPFLIGGVFHATGNTLPAGNPARGRYLFQDLARWAEHLGVPFTLSPHFPVHSLLAMRVLTTLRDDQARQRRVAHALFRACWVDGALIKDPEVLGGVLAGVEGEDAATLLAAAVTPDNKQALKDTTDAAVAYGAFGAPCFVVGDALYFGNDRLDFALRAAQAQA